MGGRGGQDQWRGGDGAGVEDGLGVGGDLGALADGAGAAGEIDGVDPNTFNLGSFEGDVWKDQSECSAWWWP